MGGASSVFVPVHGHSPMAHSETFQFNLQNAVTLAVGARVMVNNNLSVQHGVTNGAFGVVVDIVYAPGSKPPDLPLCVLVGGRGFSGCRFRSVSRGLSPFTSHRASRSTVLTSISGPKKEP
eukprot:m.370059 g.370059  ORF g.370059 m.370059 type:complete len:121 (+) comp16680_c1_seq36:214-576(+)